MGDHTEQELIAMLALADEVVFLEQAANRRTGLDRPFPLGLLCRRFPGLLRSLIFSLLFFVPRFFSRCNLAFLEDREPGSGNAADLEGLLTAELVVLIPRDVLHRDRPPAVSGIRPVRTSAARGVFVGPDRIRDRHAFDGDVRRVGDLRDRDRVDPATLGDEPAQGGVALGGGVLQGAAALGLEVPSFDVNSACTSFHAAMNLLSMMDPEKVPPFVLSVVPEGLTRTVDYNDRTAAVLWGDGAAAAVLSARSRIPSDSWSLSRAERASRCNCQFRTESSR